MHVQRTHENRYLDAAVIEIFIGLHFFDSHHFAIGRSNDGILINGKHSFGDPEKRYDKDQQAQGNNRDQGSDQGIIKAQEIKGQKIDHTKNDGSYGN
jgi:hypothetical protein